MKVFSLAVITVVLLLMYELTNYVLQGNTWSEKYDKKVSNSTPESNVTLTSLLPLFYDQGQYVAMIHHSMGF